MKVAKGNTGSRIKLGNSWSLALSDFPVNPVGYQPLTIPTSPFWNQLALPRDITPLDTKRSCACHSSTSIYKCDEGNL